VITTEGHYDLIYDLYPKPESEKEGWLHW
jgi:hypothetical protein